MSDFGYGKKRKAQVRTKREDGESNDFTGGMGDVQTPSYGARNNSFGVVRENCKNTECDEQPIKQETAGGTLRQLANEVREQLAYHESQIELQRNRLKRLETLIQEEDLDKPS